VSDDDTGSGSDDSSSEDFTRMYETTVEETFCNDFETADLIAAVQPYDDESFFDLVLKEEKEVLEEVFW